MESKSLKKIKTYEEMQVISSELKAQGKRIVFVIGSFDITHFGHTFFFEQAKEYGDVLIVGLGDDQTIRLLKGNERPVYPENVRAALVASNMMVDYAVIMHEVLKMNKDNHSEFIARIKPDVFVVNDDDSALDAKRAVIEKNGGRFVAVPRVLPNDFDYLSTTTTFEKIKKIFLD